MILNRTVLIDFANAVAVLVLARACVRCALAATLLISAGLYNHCPTAEAAADLQQAAQQSVAAVSGESAPEAAYGVVIAGLYNRDAAVRAQAEATLTKAGAGAVRALVLAVNNDKSREIVTKVLAAMGPASVRELIRLLDDPATAGGAGSALFRVIGPGSVDSTPALLECMQSNPSANGYCGAALLKITTPKAKKYVAQILPALRSRHKTARVYAAAALGEVGSGAKEAVPELMAVLKDAEEPVRLAAAVALGKIGKKAGAAAEALAEAASADASGEVRREAAEALQKVGGG